MSIVVVGSLAFDSIKTPIGQREKALGGSANYFALAAHFFSPVQVVGVIGHDFPADHLGYLSAKNIDTVGITQEKGQTFHWRGEYSENLNEAKTISTELNVFADFIPHLPEHYRSTDLLFLANIDPDLQYSVLKQCDAKIIALDTMNYWIISKPDSLKHVISKVNILFVNDAEIRQLTGEHNIISAARKAMAMGPRIVVVKRGEYGAALFFGQDYFFAPAFPMELVVDPTGAGDSFAGGFLGWVSQHGCSFGQLKKAMLAGTALSSFVIEQFSFHHVGLLSYGDIERRISALQGFLEVGP